MRKQFIYIMIPLLILSFAFIYGRSSEPSKSKSDVAKLNSADTLLCGVRSDSRYYFFNEGLYEFSVADASTGMAKYSVCVEGTEATGRCRENNFNVPWRFYVDKELPITVWKSVRRKVTGEDGKIHAVYGAQEETPILKEGGDKNWKSWKGNILKWQDVDSTGKVIFKMNIKVKKIK